jgi:hypothetical protein
MRARSPRRREAHGECAPFRARRIGAGVLILETRKGWIAEVDVLEERSYVWKETGVRQRKNGVSSLGSCRWTENFKCFVFNEAQFSYCMVSTIYQDGIGCVVEVG